MTPLFYEDSLGAKVAERLVHLPSADDELVEDPAALEAAQEAVNAEDPYAIYGKVDPDWVPVFGPSKLSGMIDIAGKNACLITMPLDAEGIAYAWDPYPPEEMPGATSHLRAVDRPFTLLVAPEDAERARELLAVSQPGSQRPVGVTASHPLTADATSARRELAWTLLVIFIGSGVAAWAAWGLYALFRFLTR